MFLSKRKSSSAIASSSEHWKEALGLPQRDVNVNLEDDESDEEDSPAKPTPPGKENCTPVTVKIPTASNWRKPPSAAKPNQPKPHHICPSQHESVISSSISMAPPSCTPSCTHNNRSQLEEPDPGKDAVQRNEVQRNGVFQLVDTGLGIIELKSPNFKHQRRLKKLKLLGQGGSSKVFKVIGEDCEIYALKEVYMKYLDEVVRKAYSNEIRLLKRLQDKPEIITICDYTWDSQECILYILLEYAEMDLSTVIKGKKHTTGNSFPSTRYFWNQMLQVVKVIHDEGVIHNDLKPENFVCIGVCLRLIDFGIANKIEQDHTSIERDVRCGTINYMAPETINTHEDNDYFKVGKPSDIWSLGCILYQMVYGATPFGHIKNKINKSIAIVSDSTNITFPDIPNKDALDVMKKCLVRNPKKRPTVEELLCHPYSTDFC